jgi:hypothetical protein
MNLTGCMRKTASATCRHFSCGFLKRQQLSLEDKNKQHRRIDTMKWFPERGEPGFMALTTRPCVVAFKH